MNIIRLLVPLLIVSVAHAEPKSTVLRHDDGKQDDRRSLGGEGHAVRFERPKEKFVITDVRLYGSRYGRDYDPFVEVAKVTICDVSLQPIASAVVPLQEFSTDRPAWVKVPLNPVRPPETFYVHVDFFASATKGVYLGIDTDGGGHSITGVPGKPGEALTDGDWMIRVAGDVRRKPTFALKASSKKVLTYDDGEPDDKQSMAGAGHAVRFSAPAGEWYLGEVSIHGSLYGGSYDPQRTLFHVFLCDSRLRVRSRSAHPYSVFDHGEGRWVTLTVPPVRVKGEFILVVFFDPTRTRGVYLSIDDVKKSHSMKALPNRSLGTLGGNQEWMIRAGVMKRGKGSAAVTPKEDGPGVDAMQLAAWKSSLEDLEKKEDLRGIQRLLTSVRKKSADAAETLGAFHMTDHVFVRYVNVPEEYAKAVAALYEECHGTLRERFGMESGFSVIPDKRLHVHLLAEKGRVLKLWTSPGSEHYPLIVNTMPDWERGLSPPSQGGPHIVYGLCHELGHVLMGWEDSRHQWAHYLGSLLVDEVVETLGTKTWPRPYEFRAEGRERFMKEIDGAEPDRSTDAGTARIIYGVGEAFGFEIWGKALSWIKKNREGKPFHAVRLYRLDDLRDALVGLECDPEKICRAFGDEGS